VVKSLCDLVKKSIYFLVTRLLSKSMPCFTTNVKLCLLSIFNLHALIRYNIRNNVVIFYCQFNSKDNNSRSNDVLCKACVIIYYFFDNLFRTVRLNPVLI